MPTPLAARLAALVAAVLLLGLAPASASAATCADHRTQADAQRAADTRDADGDGVFCESLPCPCLQPGERAAPPAPRAKPGTSCVRPRRVQTISFSATRYPAIRRSFLDAVAAGWPRTLVINRPGASSPRERLLEGVPTREGFDRDEYPPAVGRGRGKGLVRGSSPRGWKASVAYVPSSENRSHGSILGLKLRRFCNGTRFRYVFF